MFVLFQNSLAQGGVDKPITCNFIENDLIECSWVSGEVITRVKIPPEEMEAWPFFVGHRLEEEGHVQKGILMLLNKDGEIILKKDDAQAPSCWFRHLYQKVV